MERDLSLFKDLLSLLDLILTIILFRPDICSWHTAKIGALGRIASFLTFRKSFYVPHGIPFYESEFNTGYKKYRKLEKLLSYLPSKIIGVCDYDSQAYLELGVSARKVITIDNGMPELACGIEARREESDRVVFVTAARFEDQKDYDTLAAAVTKLYQLTDRFEFHIYGDGQHEARVKSLFKDVPQNMVRFKSIVQNFAEVLVQTDVYVLSSHWEGLPRTIIEAMACAKPVVATNVGGVYSLIEEGRNGFMIEPGDANKMAVALKAYVDNPALIKEHGEASYARYRYRFTLERMLDEYARLYLTPSFTPVVEAAEG